MKYLFTLLVSILFVVPSFANWKNPLTLSRYLAQDIAQKSLSAFTAKYLVKNLALKTKVDKALFSKQEVLPVQGMDRARTEIAKMSNNIYRAMTRQSVLPAGEGYIPSFSEDSKTFMETTGLHYSDMALMLRHALNNPTERNFAGYFVKDFKELQKVALNPATGQTLDEALRTAYQKAVQSKSGILIITEEIPEQFETLQGRFYHDGPLATKRTWIPAGLKDMYVMDWEKGQWISYKNSVLEPVLEDIDALPERVDISEKENGLTVEMINATRDWQGIWVWGVVRRVFVPADSGWFEQLQYAKQKGYYVLIEDFSEEETGTDKELSKVTFLFARGRGEPLYDNVYDLERGL